MDRLLLPILPWSCCCSWSYCYRSRFWSCCWSLSCSRSCGCCCIWSSLTDPFFAILYRTTSCTARGQVKMNQQSWDLKFFKFKLPEYTPLLAASRSQTVPFKSGYADPSSAAAVMPTMFCPECSFLY
jgi:hypothetical protein